MGHTYTLVVCLGICFLFIRNTLSRDKWETRHKYRKPEYYPVGIHCRGWGYPEDARLTRSCCRKVDVPCKQYKSEHRKKPNCVVNDRDEEIDVKECCLRRMDWAKGPIKGKKC